MVGAPRLHFYASRGTLQAAARLPEQDCAPGGFLDHEVGKNLNLEVHQVQALQPFNFGSYEVIAFPSSYILLVEPLLYAVESNGHSILYGTDTATLPEEVWQSFHRFKAKFDLVILDHTYGPDEVGADHLDARGVSKHVERMRKEGFLKEHGRAFATHIAHEGNPPHPRLAAYASRHGYEVAYDGFTIQL